MVSPGVHRSFAHEAWERLRPAWWPVVLASVAAALSWLIAHNVLGHTQPFFAPIAAAISLCTSRIRRSRRIAQMVFGVILGIGIGEGLSRIARHQHGGPRGDRVRDDGRRGRDGRRLLQRGDDVRQPGGRVRDPRCHAASARDRRRARARRNRRRCGRVRNWRRPVPGRAADAVAQCRTRRVADACHDVAARGRADLWADRGRA